jgi:hypothetical protein
MAFLSTVWKTYWVTWDALKSINLLCLAYLKHEHCSQQYSVRHVLETWTLFTAVQCQTCTCNINTVHSSTVSDMYLQHEHCSQQYSVRHVFIPINCYRQQASCRNWFNYIYSIKFLSFYCLKTLTIVLGSVEIYTPHIWIQHFATLLIL